MSRVALVTGGTRGIGAEISLALKEKGYTVAATYFGRHDVAREFERVHGIAVFNWDVSDSAQCSAGVDQVASRIGPVEVLVNNAGITRDRAFRKMSDDDWHSVINTNLNSVFYMCRAVIEPMRAAGFGRIINISSINGQRGRYGQANYSAAKAGVYGLTKALAMEYAKRGITVNAIAPGHIDTDIVRSSPPELIESLLAEIPVGRLGTPMDVARCAAFLASDDAGFITGSTVTVNGGTYLI